MQEHDGLLMNRICRLASSHHVAAQAQALLEHGRLRYDQLLRYVAEQQDAQEAELAGTVEACFLRLLHAQQVERVPSCDLPPPADAARSAASVSSCFSSCQRIVLLGEALPSGAHAGHESSLAVGWQVVWLASGREPDAALHHMPAGVSCVIILHLHLWLFALRGRRGAGCGRSRAR